MPDAGELTQFSVVVDSINEPIRTKDQLANIWVSIFGNHAADFRGARESIRVQDQLIPKRHCALGIITRNKDNDIVKVVAGCGRPD